MKNACKYFGGVSAGACLLGIVLCLVFPTGCRTLSPGGAFVGQPEELTTRLSPAAHNLLSQSFAAIGPAPLEDYHAHIIGVGTSNSLAAVNASMFSWWHPIKKIKTGVFLSACGISNVNRLDQEYVDRLVRLARGFDHPVKMHILAMDHFYTPDGTANMQKTDFYMPNDVIVRLAEQYPDIFVPVISVHPYRPDALAELEKWAQRGVRCVKWLPNTQGMDPSDPHNDAFYRIMKRYNMVLLTHTGIERSVDSSTQAFGNPLLLRRPLDLGVKVIMAHCAGSGRNADFDHPGKKADSFDLFLRMMYTERYRGLLFADISATTMVNRTPRPILELIRRPELHDRLVNGSDYPLPAFNCTIWTRKLARLGMITTQERESLNEIYNCNPLLFDYVLKRTVRDPKTGNQLPAKVFLNNPLI